MLLALDAGNSTITAGCIAGGEVRARAVFATAARTSDEYAVLMSQALAMHGVEPGGFDGAIVACVVPQMTKTLARAARMLAGVEPLVVGAGVKTGLNIGIDDPSQLGADLVASAVGALADREPPLIICDLGTATSVCVIDARSRLLGGAILPGAAVSLDALAGSAALLPGITLEAPKQCIGTNTNDCMKSGAVFGTRRRHRRHDRPFRAGARLRGALRRHRHSRRPHHPPLPPRNRDRRRPGPEGPRAHLD